MQKRPTNLAMTGLAGAVLVGGIATGLAAQGNVQEPATSPVAARSAGAGTSSAEQSDGKTAEDGAKATTEKAKKHRKRTKALLTGTTTASYFWDDGSGINGDTGAPASGEDMQKGMFASPSWPMMTKVKVSYKGRSVTGFVGDRGPGEPSHRGVMLDLDTYTFRYLLDGEKPDSKYDAGTGEGHIKGVKYEVLKWGSGAGTKGEPEPLG